MGFTCGKHPEWVSPRLHHYEGRAVLDIEPMNAPLGARVRGLNLARVPTEAQIAAVEEALEKYGVLVFPEQEISPAEHVAFSRSFAELEMTMRIEARLPEHPEIFVVGNTGEKLVSFAPKNPDDPVEWHADHMHLAVPARASLLHALEVPAVGADTLFSCMYRAFDALSIDGQNDARTLTMRHSVSGLKKFLRTKGQTGADQAAYESPDHFVATWPLVRHHPVTGRPSLYFGSQVTIGIEGWPEDRALAYIETLAAIASRPDHIYRHRWQAGDAVLWDNRRTVHAGTPFDVERYRRCMHRTTWREDQVIQ